MNMSSESELMEKVKSIVEKRGRGAIEKAAQEILGSLYKGEEVSSALKYFARVTLQGALPVFPALISLSCDAVGGKTEKTTSIGAALTLMAAAADIHDDIIDQSPIKYSRKTVFGKFGDHIALLAGDALLFQGLMLLHRECESLPKKQEKAILRLISETFFEISSAETKEIRLRRKLNTTVREYFEVIELKSVVPEMHCKIGGILGNANETTIRLLGDYGRTFGILSTIREEFIDFLEYSALQSRIKNECPPLPLIYALQNLGIRNELMPLLESPHISRKEANRIVKIVLGSKEVQKLKKETELAIEKELRSFLIGGEMIQNEAKLLLMAMTDGL